MKDLKEVSLKFEKSDLTNRYIALYKPEKAPRIAFIRLEGNLKNIVITNLANRKTISPLYAYYESLLINFKNGEIYFRTPEEKNFSKQKISEKEKQDIQKFQIYKMAIGNNYVCKSLRAYPGIIISSESISEKSKAYIFIKE